MFPYYFIVNCHGTMPIFQNASFVTFYTMVYDNAATWQTFAFVPFFNYFGCYLHYYAVQNNADVTYYYRATIHSVTVPEISFN